MPFYFINELKLQFSNSHLLAKIRDFGDCCKCSFQYQRFLTSGDKEKEKRNLEIVASFQFSIKDL